MKKINQKRLATIYGGLSGAECYAAALGFLFGGPLVTAVLAGSGIISGCWNS